jgi:hypothetical protein
MLVRYHIFCYESYVLHRGTESFVTGLGLDPSRGPLARRHTRIAPIFGTTVKCTQLFPFEIHWPRPRIRLDMGRVGADAFELAH